MFVISDKLLVVANHYGTLDAISVDEEDDFSLCIGRRGCQLQMLQPPHEFWYYDALLAYDLCRSGSQEENRFQDAQSNDIWRADSENDLFVAEYHFEDKHGRCGAWSILIRTQEILRIAKSKGVWGEGLTCDGSDEGQLAEQAGEDQYIFWIRGSQWVYITWEDWSKNCAFRVPDNEDGVFRGTCCRDVCGMSVFSLDHDWRNKTKTPTRTTLVRDTDNEGRPYWRSKHSCLRSGSVR